MPVTLKVPQIKIPQIARWRIAGVGDRKICDMLGMSQGGLSRILASPEYMEYEAALMNGHLNAMDRALAGKVEAIHQELRCAVPAAVRCLVDSVTQRRDLKAAMAAAKEILDRDPDRVLPSLDKSVESQTPGVPAEVLQAATEEGNRIAESYQEKKPN